MQTLVFINDFYILVFIHYSFTNVSLYKNDLPELLTKMATSKSGNQQKIKLAIERNNLDEGIASEYF